MIRFRSTAKVLLILLAILLASVPPVFSGEDTGGVTITHIDIEIDGNTIPIAVLNELHIREGKVFDTYEDLEKVLNSRAEDLKNRRLFKEFTWNTISTGPETAEIEIRIVDAFTILPRPMIKFSSDTGLLLGLKLEYFNAFGTLTDQILEGYWSPNEIKGLLDVRNIAIGPLHLDVMFEQYFGTTRHGSPEGIIRLEYSSMYSLGTILTDIPLGAASKWSYQFEPVFKGLYRYDFITNDTDYDDEEFMNEGFAGGFNTGFYTDQVYWEKNFRRGFEFSLMSNNLWYQSTGRADAFLESDLYGYLPLAEWFEISGRVGGFFAIDGFREDAGDRLRGVVDYMTFGKWGAYASIQTNFRVIPIDGIMEVQIRPFFDAGYVYSSEWSHGAESWEYCVGGTLILFFDFLPSMNLNMEFGWDLKRNLPEIIIDTVLLL